MRAIPKIMVVLCLVLLVAVLFSGCEPVDASAGCQPHPMFYLQGTHYDCATQR